MAPFIKMGYRKEGWGKQTYGGLEFMTGIWTGEIDPGVIYLFSQQISMEYLLCARYILGNNIISSM